MVPFRNPKEEQKLSGKKKILVVLAVLLVIAAGGIVWLFANYHVVGFQCYPKNAAALDLRGQEISVEDYEKLSEKMPNCEIRWDVPFQGGTVADDVTELTVETLADEDVKVLCLLKQLKTVHAEACRDYVQLFSLRLLRPEVDVDYSVHFSGGSYAWDVKEIVLSAATEEDIPLLEHLSELETVALGPGTYDTKTVEALRGTARNMGLEFGVVLGGSLYRDTQTSLELEGVTDAELDLLQFLQSMEELHLVNPEAAPEKVFNLENSYPDAQITWEVEIGGETFDNTVTEVDLSAVVIEDLAEVEKKMAYLPNAEKVIFGLCGIDNPDWGSSKSKLAVSQIENEDLAAYRDRVREDYKVVWTVRLGPSIALRTDADNFMPNHFGVGQLFDDYAYNLRYCEDMVCLDVGHMTLTDISFVEYMPNLKYLILAWTEVQYIEPIRSCKNLIWLELDNSCIRDYSPLVDCTALQDLNIGNTFCDITPILEMTWLKNLYMIFGSGASAYKASQALPDTHVVATGTATVGAGWRRLQNYYDMRDCLGMYYMN